MEANPCARPIPWPAHTAVTDRLAFGLRLLLPEVDLVGLRLLLLPCFESLDRRLLSGEEGDFPSRLLELGDLGIDRLHEAQRRALGPGLDSLMIPR